jgi:CPA1 family monovalent cation:H+ antiporter
MSAQDMASLQNLEIVVVLLMAVLVLTTLAQNLLLPYPILLVLGGIALSAVPKMPVLRLDPDLVFLVFLPPILWSAAYFTSLRDFRANLRSITFLAVGLVAATTAAVAAVARWMIPGMGWPEALALGAIVSPPDAVAATAIGRRLNIPHRVIVILEGESLVNDATALVLYRAAVAAAVTGAFSFADGVVLFVLASVGGVAVGLAVSELARRALALTEDSFTEVLVTLLAPYASWILAERLHVSAVLACVAGGLYLRQHLSEAVTPVTRLQARAVWDVFVFLLNGFIFILIGLQLATLRPTVGPGELKPLLVQAAVISAVAIGVRLIWVPIAIGLPPLLSVALRRRESMPEWPPVFLMGWIGMRGIVSLAAALALPFATARGAPFPFREDIILLTFAVIIATLVLQGLTLAPLLRRLGLRDDYSLADEELRARDAAVGAALDRLEELAGESWARPAHLEQLRALYAQRRARASAIGSGDGAATAEDAGAFRRLRHEALTAERRRVIGLRDRGEISDEVLHRLEHELDVEALQIGTGELRPR